MANYRCKYCDSPIVWGIARGPLEEITFEEALRLRTSFEAGDHLDGILTRSGVVWWHSGGAYGSGEHDDYARGGPLPWSLLEAARDTGLQFYARHIPRCRKRGRE